MARDQAATILVVEDDTSIQDLLRELLADEGYRVLQAVDGAHGLRLAATDRPALILLDVGLHPSSGAEVLVQLRDDPATSCIPVIALTGQRSPDGDVLHGFDDWIEKPFDIHVLLEHVGRLAEGPASTPAGYTAADSGG